MKQNKLLMSFVAFMTFLSMNATVYSGKCGSNSNSVKWELDTETGIIHIAGKGKMGFRSNEKPEWLQYASLIKSCKVDSGVTEICDYAFYGCDQLESVSLPSTLTRLGLRSFEGCFSLESIKIPDNVEMVLRNTFEGCVSLKSVNIPQSAKYIRQRAFKGCKNLKSIYVPKKVQEIENLAFEDCVNLEFFSVDEKCELCLKDSVFSGCTSLTQITLPQSVKKTSVFTYDNSCIEEINIVITDFEKPNTTYYNEGLKYNYIYDGKVIEGDYVIPEGVRTMGKAILGGCYKLTSVKTSTTTTEIQTFAFEGCKNLKSIEITPSVKVIEHAFSGCCNVTSFKLPNSVEKIDFDPYNDCPKLDDISLMVENWEDDNAVVAYYGQHDRLSFGFKYFYRNQEVFGDYVFPEGLTKIGCDALSLCKAVNSIAIPNTVTSIGDCAFQRCANLRKVDLGESIKLIPDCAFWGDVALTKIEIPRSVTRIGTSAFGRCANLREVLGMEGVKNIEAYAFSSCSSLKNFVFPSKMDTIDYEVFNFCTSLCDVKLPDTLTYIGDNVFAGCTALPIIDNVRYADSYLVCALGDNPTYTIKDGTKYIGTEAFVRHRNLAEINIPSSVRSIGRDAFSGCNSLQKLVIPEGVKTIKTDAFACCRTLKEVSIPKSVASIGESAFYGCTELQSIDVNWVNPISPDDYTFEEVDKKTCKLYIPAGTYNAYYYKAGWASFRANMIEKDVPDAIDEVTGKSIPEIHIANNSVSLSNNNGKYCIYSSNGSLVAQGCGNNIVNLVKGVYLLKLENGLSRKVVVE